MDARTTLTTGTDRRQEAMFDARAEVLRQLRKLVPDQDVGEVERHLPLRDEIELGTAGLGPLLAALAEDTGIVVEPHECPPRLTLDDLAQLLVEGRDRAHWRIDVTISADGPHQATDRARLTAGPDHLIGVGTATRHPADPDVADVADEVAAARAIADLSGQLLALADERISAWDDGAVPLAR